LSAQSNQKPILALIGIGSNIDPEDNLQKSLDKLSEQVSIRQLASIWQTPAVGSDGPDYLNSAVLIESFLSLDQLKTHLLSRIEHDLGRLRSVDKSADRTIDLDILMYDGICLDDDLWIQAHVAFPAAEIFPDCANPQSGETLRQAALRLASDEILCKRTDLSWGNVK
jgi:2-amino-4-hydroxy-6-hydroxymethyldihydropteridine diphosphokinase